MTREEAIEILIGEAVCVRPILSCDFCARYKGTGNGCDGSTDKEVEEAVLLLKGASNDAEISALRQQEHPQWISVKDRLPGRYETVLIAISTVNGYGDPAKLVTIGGYDHSEKRWEQYTSTDRQLCPGEAVTHWMPLPEPPRGE